MINAWIAYMTDNCQYEYFCNEIMIKHFLFRKKGHLQGTIFMSPTIVYM